ncbi:hypothetical protein MRX96_052503 [Rhipicephalus microplus]
MATQAENTGTQGHWSHCPATSDVALCACYARGRSCAALKGETPNPNGVRSRRHALGVTSLVVLKPRKTLDLKATFVPGQAGAAVRSLNVISVPAAERVLGDIMLVVGRRQLK